MGFASGLWHAYSRHDICAGIKIGPQTNYEMLGYVLTGQLGVAPIFTI